MNTPFRVSPWQVAVLAFALALCVSPLGAVRPLLRVLGPAAWTAIVPSAAIGLCGVAAALALARRWPGTPVDEVAARLLGRWPGRAYALALAALFAAGAAVNLNIFARSAHVTLLTRLPVAYAAALTAAAATYAAAFGPEVVARAAEVLAPGVGIALLAVFLAPLANAEPGRLLPLAGAPWRAYCSWPVLTDAGLLRGFLPVLVLAPFSRPLPRGAPLLAVGLAGVLTALAAALPAAVYGAPFAATLLSPFVATIGTVSWQWLPFQRLVVVVTVVWYAVAFIVFATYVWMAAWLARRLAPALPWTALVVAIGAGGAAAASLNLAGELTERIAQAWNAAVVVLGVLVPGALLLAAPRRRAAARGPAVGAAAAAGGRRA